MRVVRTIVLLAAAAIFMPSPPEEQLEARSGDPPVTELVSAAVSTVADMGDFCSRQAAVCDTAHYLAVKLEGKARYSVELLYQWAQESRDQAQQAHRDDAGAPQGRTAAADTGKTAGRSTLRLDDLIPEWRAPKA
ncbi:MAG: DUF5330 domain-containing protein [Parvibaculaceae bacterium]